MVLLDESLAVDAAVAGVEHSVELHGAVTAGHVDHHLASDCRSGRRGRRRSCRRARRRRGGRGLLDRRGVWRGGASGGLRGLRRGRGAAAPAPARGLQDAIGWCASVTLGQRYGRQRHRPRRRRAPYL